MNKKCLPLHKILNIFISVLSILLSSLVFADNPLVSQVYTADPAARVFNGRMYVITTHDRDGQSDYSQLLDYYLFSSDDMINWRDHGIVFNARTDTTWANLAYAPDMIYRNGKYYLYFPNGASSIGVAVADNPDGPYTDPLGRPLVDRNTPNADVQWLFDPGVFIDDDGQAYLYFGGGGPGNARVIRLNQDMISTNGAAITLDVPNFFEALYMHKRNGTYYLSYSSNPGTGLDIQYMTSHSPTSDFQHRGVVLDNPWQNNYNNNHQSFVEFNGQWYAFYHNRAVSNARGGGSYERSINVDRLYYNDDGTLQQVNTGVAGVPKLKNVDPFSQNEAETLDREQGIETENASGGSLDVMFDTGDWIKIANLDFGSGARGFTARVAAIGNTSIDILLDDVNSSPIGTLQISATGGNQNWQTRSTGTAFISGVHDVFLRVKGRVNLDWYRFTRDSGNDNNVLEVELESLSNQNSFSPFSVRSDSAASGEQYIVWPEDGSEQILGTASDTATGQVEIAFTLSQTSDVQFQIQVRMANANDDSFYYKVDSGSWNTQNNTFSGNWDTLTPATFTGLAAGTHRLRMKRWPHRPEQNPTGRLYLPRPGRRPRI